MYESKYVRRRKTRIWVAIGGGISTIVVATLSIVSFLGRIVGTFTIRLEAGNVSLSLCEKSNFEKATSYLRIDKLPTFQETTYANLVERIGDDQIDNENTGYLLGANYARDGVTVKDLNYFKYTYFVKNVGTIPATYDMTINIIDSQTDKGKGVEDTLRIMLYSNDDENTHEKTVYAKRSIIATKDEDGKDVYYNERISTEEYGYAEPFESSKVIATITQDYFEVGQVKRYTLVMWLEGFDPQSNREYDAPENARIKLGVEINAYEI